MPKVTCLASSRIIKSSISFKTGSGVKSLEVLKAASASPSIINCIPINLRSHLGSVRILSKIDLRALPIGYMSSILD